MKTATRMLAVGVLAALLTPAALPAFASVSSEPVGGFYGTVTVDATSGQFSTTRPSLNAPVVVYDNTTSPANTGVSSSDLASVWGDELLTTGTGVLTDMKFTVFNSASSAGPLLSATFGIAFYDFATSAVFGSFGVNVGFGTGLLPGFYSTVTVTNLSPFAISLLTTNLLVAQTITASTGTANLLGIASLDPVTIGSSPPTFYVQSSTIGGGVPGFYTVSGKNANPGYQISVDAPVPTRSSSWGRIKSLYR